MLYRRGYINDEIGTYFIISDVEKGEGGVEGIGVEVNYSHFTAVISSVSEFFADLTPPG